MKIELVGLKTYLSPEGLAFTKGKVYEISDGKAAEMLSRAMPSGQPIFKSVSDGDIVQREERLQQKNSSKVHVVSVSDDQLDSDESEAPKRRGRPKKVVVDGEFDSAEGIKV